MTRTALLLLTLAGAAHAGDYRLQPGDVLALSVLAPPIREELPVDLDGNVALPLAGPVAAAGRTLAEMTAEVRARLAAVALPPAAGEPLPTPIWPAAVTLGLRQYRPVYVAGDVRAPGAFPFVPGLTARRALALAGGAGRGPDAALRRLELEGTLARLAAERTATAQRLARLQLLADPAAPADLAGPERAVLDAGRARDAADRRHYAAAAGQARAEIDELTRRLATETEGAAADRADFDTVAGLREAGTATALRLTDARRALLFSTTRQLQTATELSRASRDLGAVEHEGDDRARERRLQALTDAADAAARLAALDAEAEAARAALAWLSDTPAGVTVTASDGTAASLAPDEDRPLAPGDLVTVTAGASGG